MYNGVVTAYNEMPALGQYRAAVQTMPGQNVLPASGRLSIQHWPGAGPMLACLSGGGGATEAINNFLSKLSPRRFD